MSALAGDHGIGDLGASARRFVDWLARAGMRIWQVLPLHPVGADGSPYASPSAFLGDPHLIDLAGLCDAGLLEPGEVAGAARLERGRVDRGFCARVKEPLIREAAGRLLDRPGHPLHGALVDLRRERPWLAACARYHARKRRAGGAPWWAWAWPEASAASGGDLDREVRLREAIEVLFDARWRALTRYAEARGVSLFGDLPLYVAHDSDAVWMRPELFSVAETGEALRVAGVPPDAFSDTGQQWGNPVYRWDRMAADGFRFLIERLRQALRRTPVVRIDHFRGLESYWAIPAGAEDARAGRWEPGPGEALIEAFEEAFGRPLPLVAEDLGLIDDRVRGLVARAGVMGMLVLQFAFGDADPGRDPDGNRYLPHRHVEGAVVYPGTHDNDTLIGWWRRAASAVRAHARRYLGEPRRDPEDASDAPAIARALIRATFASKARWAIVPIQDLLELGSEARLNHPGTVSVDNWTWRLSRGALTDDLAARVRTLSVRSGRAPADSR